GPFWRKPALVPPVVEADLGEDEHLVPGHTAAPEPLADGGFALAADMAVHPGGGGVRSGDRVEAGVEEAVEQVEGRLLVRRPAEHVAAEYDRGDGKAGPAESALCHGNSECWPANASPRNVWRKRHLSKRELSNRTDPAASCVASARVHPYCSTHSRNWGGCPRCALEFCRRRRSAGSWSFPRSRMRRTAWSRPSPAAICPGRGTWRTASPSRMPSVPTRRCLPRTSSTRSISRYRRASMSSGRSRPPMPASMCCPKSRLRRRSARSRR